MSTVKGQHNHLLLVLKVLFISLYFQFIQSQPVSTTTPSWSLRWATTPNDPTTYAVFPIRPSSIRRPAPSPAESRLTEDDLNDVRRDNATRRDDNIDGRGTTKNPRITQTSPPSVMHLKEEPQSYNAPKLNLTAEDSNNDIIPMVWSRYHQNGSIVEETSLNLRDLRNLTLTFTCNDTFPIKWSSRRSFGTSKWYIDESRYFNGSWRGTPNIIYTLELKLTYEKEESIPPKQEFVCARLVEFSNDGGQNKQPGMEVVKGANCSLSFKSIFETHPEWPAEGEDDPNGRQPSQYSEPLGANVDCLQELKWNERSKRLECTSEGDANLTFAYIHDNCYDSVSCERRFTPRTCWKSWRDSKTENKAPTDLWTERDTPPSGVVHCKWQNQTAESKSSALLFYHSLPPFCPEDHPNGRRQIYITNENSSIPDDTQLRRDFMSFCATEDLVKHNEQGPYPTIQEIPIKYAGEYMSVSCIASLYHFAKGMRIGQRLTNGSYLYTAVTDSATTANDNEGYINYTAKVLITDPSVTGIVCEAYLKQSTNSILKLLPMPVKTPRNLSFIGGLTQVAYYNYSGQSDFALRCDAEGDPQPTTITWRRQNQTIPEATRTTLHTNGSLIESKLLFPSARQLRKLNVSELHGTYICEAANRLNRIERTFHVGLVKTNSSINTIVDDGTTAEAKKEEYENWVACAFFLVCTMPWITGAYNSNDEDSNGSRQVERLAMRQR